MRVDQVLNYSVVPTGTVTAISDSCDDIHMGSKSIDNTKQVHRTNTRIMVQLFFLSAQNLQPCASPTRDKRGLG